MDRLYDKPDIFSNDISIIIFLDFELLIIELIL